MENRSAREAAERETLAARKAAEQAAKREEEAVIVRIVSEKRENVRLAKYDMLMCDIYTVKKCELQRRLALIGESTNDNMSELIRNIEFFANRL